MSTKLKAKTGASITSFLVRSITAGDRKQLDLLKRSTGNATDSGAILYALVMCQDERGRRIEAERQRDELEAKAATLVDAIIRRQAAEKDAAAGVKALGDVKNSAFIRSMHT